MYINMTASKFKKRSVSTSDETLMNLMKQTNKTHHLKKLSHDYSFSDSYKTLPKINNSQSYVGHSTQK